MTNSGDQTQKYTPMNTSCYRQPYIISLARAFYLTTTRLTDICIDVSNVELSLTFARQLGPAATRGGLQHISNGQSGSHSQPMEAGADAAVSEDLAVQSHFKVLWGCFTVFLNNWLL